MRIVTVGNLKGGTGKTTLAVNLAAAAEGRGIRTVIIDLDPQQSAGKWADQRPKAGDGADRWLGTLGEGSGW